MATYTPNIDLKKPAQSDKIRIADLNGNADNIDAALGADFGVSNKPSVDDAVNSLGAGLAIISNGDIHAAITAGQYVYVRGHGTLTEGLYVATANVSQNGALTGSNVDAVSGGGLNALNSKITSVDISNRTELLSALSALGENQTQSISIYGDIATEAIGWQGRTFGILSKTAASRFELAVFTANGQKIVVSEINASTGALENKQMFRPQAFQTKEYSYAYSITANSSLSVSVSNLNVSTPTGYTPISIVNINTANDNVLPRGFRCDVTTGNMVWLRNVAGSTQTGTLYVNILYTLTG